MAYKGKNTCKILKDIRRQIAEANDIELVIRECTYQGDCAGTCPRCEAEVAYLERELAKRQALGKAVKIVGLASMSLAAAACSSKPQNNNTDQIDDQWMGEPEEIILEDTTSTPDDDTNWAVRGKVSAPVMDSYDVVEEGIIEITSCGIVDPDALDPDQVEDYPDDYIYPVVDTLPEMEGGTDAYWEYLENHLQYPASALSDSVEGRVIVRFVVEPDGTLSNPEVVRSVREDLDTEALRVIGMLPPFRPGIHRGKPVRVYMHYPVKFQLKKENN